MRLIRSCTRRLVQAIARFALTRRVALGQRRYVQWLLLPNRFSARLDHEAFLNDIYRIALEQKAGAILDVGVNTGQTLVKMLNIDKVRPYFGFEPLSMAAACVESFLVENRITNYHVIPVALSDRNGICPIRIRGTGIDAMVASSASIVNAFRPDAFYDYEKYVYAARGDDVIDGLGVQSVALVKIDVEGGELEVLKGLRETVLKCRPFLVFEVLHHYLAVSNEPIDEATKQFREARIQEIERLIRETGYRIYHIRGWKEVAEIGVIQPDRGGDLSSTDFIAVPEEHMDGFCGGVERLRRVVRA